MRANVCFASGNITVADCCYLIALLTMWQIFCLCHLVCASRDYYTVMDFLTFYTPLIASWNYFNCIYKYRPLSKPTIWRSRLPSQWPTAHLCLNTPYAWSAGRFSCQMDGHTTSQKEISCTGRWELLLFGRRRLHLSKVVLKLFKVLVNYVRNSTKKIFFWFSTLLLGLWRHRVSKSSPRFEMRRRVCRKWSRIQSLSGAKSLLRQRHFMLRFVAS